MFIITSGGHFIVYIYVYMTYHRETSTRLNYIYIYRSLSLSIALPISLKQALTIDAVNSIKYCQFIVAIHDYNISY